MVGPYTILFNFYFYFFLHKKGHILVCGMLMLLLFAIFPMT